MKFTKPMWKLAFLCLAFTFSGQLQASVLGAFYTIEQARLNHLGYTQNILNLKMPSGDSCKISYFYHRSSKDEKRYILFHGFLDRSLTWRKLISEIPENSEIKKSLVLIDLPHHGDSKCAEVNSFARAVLCLSSASAKRRKHSHSTLNLSSFMGV